MKDELSLLQVQLTYKKRLEAMLKELLQQQAALTPKVASLEARMASERKDVDTLEGRSLAAFFYFCLGKKDEKLNTERREYYAARVKYEAARRELDAIETDIQSTREDLSDLADCEARYIQAIERKRLAIESAGTALSQEFLEKEQFLNHLHAQEKELEEAISAGTNVLRTASDVLSSLRHIEGVGYLDIFGQNALTNMARQETIDDAQKNVEQLQIDLQRFNKELSDIPSREALQPSIDRMLRFSDGFFENLFAEASVPERIRHAHQETEQILDPTLGILRQLQNHLESVRHQMTKAKAEVNELILEIEL